jgi:hypothetical protein
VGWNPWPPAGLSASKAVLAQGIGARGRAGWGRAAGGVGDAPGGAARLRGRRTARVKPRARWAPAPIGAKFRGGAGRGAGRDARIGRKLCGAGRAVARRSLWES